MRRREFIAGLGGAVTWPLAARAQKQPDRIRRLGVIMALGEDDPSTKAFLPAFVQRLQELGWSDGRNIKMDIRWAAGDPDRARAFAKELVELQPDVILSHSTPVTAAFQGGTRTIPIVFASVSDPVGDGFVASLARPGGNLTGFIDEEAGMAGKWLEILAEIVPGVKRAAIIFNPDTAPGRGSYFLSPFETAARSLKVEPIAAPVRSDAEIATIITSLGREAGSGAVMRNDSFLAARRAWVIPMLAEHKLPAVYASSTYTKAGGLLAYGADRVDIFRRAASYVDRILRGAKTAELPVQLPTKFEMSVNAKTAKALGLQVPPSILLRADEVIE
jgi:putative tryptophan/tyrosine transport system substrate-binding protein